MVWAFIYFLSALKLALPASYVSRRQESQDNLDGHSDLELRIPFGNYMGKFLSIFVINI